MAAGRVIVTGGAGFIGSHVVEAFLAEGFDALVVDDLSTGSRANVAAGVELLELDVRDGRRLETAFTDFAPTLVCHLAAQASVTVSVTEPERDLAVNVAGTLNVCEAARRTHAPVVFASTGGAIYGDSATLPTSEDATPAPLAPYGASKLAGEAYVTTWGRLYELPNVVLRLGNVYGPRQIPHGEAGVVAIFIEQLGRGDAPTLYGNGRPTRDYVYVEDVARAFVAAARSAQPGVLNVATGRETSVSELYELVQRALDVRLEPRYAPLRPGEVERSTLDIRRIEAALSWRPETDLVSGLARTVATG